MAIAAHQWFGRYAERVPVAGVLPHDGFIRVLPPMPWVTRGRASKRLTIAAPEIRFLGACLFSHTRQPEHVDRVAQHRGLLLRQFETILK
jgi:hypothetical protein